MSAGGSVPSFHNDRFDSRFCSEEEKKKTEINLSMQALPDKNVHIIASLISDSALKKEKKIEIY